MLTIVVYVVVTLVVAVALFLLSVVVFGRGELLPPVPAGHTVTALPEGPLDGDDLRAVRFGMSPRGYTMAEVDWVLEQAAAEIERLHALHRHPERGPGASHGMDGDSAPASPDGATR